MRRDSFQAIADPTRRSIISMLVGQSLNLNAVAEHFEISRPAISKQIKILVECGLIKIKQEGRERFCEVQLQKLGEVSNWIEPYRIFWTEKLDALEGFLEKGKEKDQNDKKSKKMNNQPFIIERLFDIPVSKVWDALTKNEQIRKWYFQLPDFKTVVGFEFTFTAGADDHKPYRHLCRIVEVIPGKKLSYSWRYDGFPGNSTVTFELFEEGKKTKLRLTHAGIETFDQVNPDFAKKNFEEGWTAILDNSLKVYLETIIVEA